MERLVPFDPQPIGDANVWLTPYVSPCGERFYHKAATEGEGYETQFFHVDGDPVDVRRVEGVWYWVFDDEENSDMSERLDEIRQRCEAATPNIGKDAEDAPCFERADDGSITIRYLSDDDEAFIAHARTDIPYLLDELARLNELLSVYKGWKDAIEDSGDEDGWAVALRWKQENAALTSKVAALEADAERWRTALGYAAEMAENAPDQVRTYLLNAARSTQVTDAAGGERC